MSAKTQSPAVTSPVVVILDDNHDHDDNGAARDNNGDARKKKRAKTASSSSSSNGSNDSKPRSQQKSEQSQRSSQSNSQPTTTSKIFHPDSNTLLDDMLHPLSKRDFLQHHFRKNAVHIQRHHPPQHAGKVVESVSDICHNYLFDLDAREIFAETSSENVFLWLRPPPSSSDSNSTPYGGSSSSSAASSTLNSVEISDPETAYALHKSGSHPAYCRAPPMLEQHLVGSLLRATGLGGGHYHPPHAETVTLGGNTTLGRGEVELFIGAAASGSSASPTNSDGKRRKCTSVNGNANVNEASASNDNDKKHTTGWHTDFQENFTIQLSGVKRWTFRRGRVRHPIRATTPHYARDASVVENQLKLARLSCLAGNDDTASGMGSDDAGPYGFEYGDNNAYGPEETVTLHPGDVLYFPSGMWHRVETVRPGVSLNVSLMGTTYATLVCEALQHVMAGSDEGWREVVTTNTNNHGGPPERLEGLLGGLGKLVDDFVNKQGGASSLLPPALCYPPLGQEEEDGPSDDSSEDENNGDEGESDNEDQRSNGGGSEQMDEEIEEDGHHEEEEEEDDDVPSSGIIVTMEDFEGPPGWMCTKPTNAKLVKNPLACLMAMPDITGQHQKQQNQNGKGGENNEEGVKKQYILNVNFAGNEMMESHVRVMFETSDRMIIDQMNSYLEWEARGQDLGCTVDAINNKSASGKKIRRIPPRCLFYYGYFSWSNTA